MLACRQGFAMLKSVTAAAVAPSLPKAYARETHRHPADRFLSEIHLALQGLPLRLRGAAWRRLLFRSGQKHRAGPGPLRGLPGHPRPLPGLQGRQRNPDQKRATPARTERLRRMSGLRLRLFRCLPFQQKRRLRNNKLRAAGVTLRCTVRLFVLMGD
jgi:hypothetical protein